VITRWHIAGSEGPRAATLDQIAEALAIAGVDRPVEKFENVPAAWGAACKIATDNDKILVFGSFLTVAAVLRERQRARAAAKSAP
jgi:dihydrofolate synthase / folylpolyglutamate synthase